MDLPDFTTYTDADLQELTAAAGAELSRRAVLSSAESRLAAFLNEYAAAGGDPDELVQKAPDVASAVTEKRKDAEAREKHDADDQALAAGDATAEPVEPTSPAETVTDTAADAVSDVGKGLGGLLG